MGLDDGRTGAVCRRGLYQHEVFGFFLIACAAKVLGKTLANSLLRITSRRPGPLLKSTLGLWRDADAGQRHAPNRGLPQKSTLGPHRSRGTALHSRFGAGYKAVRQLKPTFREALGLAQAVYPEARVDLEAEGVVLLLFLRPCHAPRRSGLGWAS